MSQAQSLIRPNKVFENTDYLETNFKGWVFTYSC